MKKSDPHVLYIRISFLTLSKRFSTIRVELNQIDVTFSSCNVKVYVERGTRLMTVFHRYNNTELREPKLGWKRIFNYCWCIRCIFTTSTSRYVWLFRRNFHINYLIFYLEYCCRQTFHSLILSMRIIHLDVVRVVRKDLGVYRFHLINENPH